MSSNLDVSQLSKESLPEGTFPVSRTADFRVFFEPRVHEGMVGHAKEDKTVESCGVVVGKWEQDQDGPYARVTEFIRCDDATNKFAEVTFTHESWTHINSEMDSKYPDLSIVGWYHSHPDFGIFLSDRDMFIQQNFFSGPGQFAFVVDPVRDTEGLFEWRDNKAELKQHYWIGNEVRTSAAASDPPTDGENRAPAAMAAVGSSQPEAFSGERATGLPLSAILGAMAVFMLGYTLSNWSNRWEREKIIEGAVAHFGVYKLMHMGLDEPLTGARQLAQSVDTRSQTLRDAHLALLKDEPRSEAAKAYGEFTKELGAMRQLLDAINSRYAMSDVERNKLAAIVATKFKELRDPPPAKATSDKSGKQTSGEEKKTSPAGKNSAAPQNESPAKATPAAPGN